MIPEIIKAEFKDNFKLFKKLFKIYAPFVFSLIFGFFAFVNIIKFSPFAFLETYMRNFLLSLMSNQMYINLVLCGVFVAKVFLAKASSICPANPTAQIFCHNTSLAYFKLYIQFANMFIRKAISCYIGFFLLVYFLSINDKEMLYFIFSLVFRLFFISVSSELMIWFFIYLNFLHKKTLEIFVSIAVIFTIFLKIEWLWLFSIASIPFITDKCNWYRLFQQANISYRVKAAATTFDFTTISELSYKLQSILGFSIAKSSNLYFPKDTSVIFKDLIFSRRILLSQILTCFVLIVFFAFLVRFVPLYKNTIFSFAQIIIIFFMNMLSSSHDNIKRSKFYFSKLSYYELLKPILSTFFSIICYLIFCIINFSSITLWALSIFLVISNYLLFLSAAFEEKYNILKIAVALVPLIQLFVINNFS